MKKLFVGLALLLASPALAEDKKAPPPMPEQEPNWAEVRKGAEALLRCGLYDPQAATIVWDGGWSWGHVKPFQLWSKREWGWLGCLRLNGKNRLGGYVGEQAMWVLLEPDGTMKTGSQNSVTSECDDGSARPPLQPAFMDATPATGTMSIADELGKLADLRDKGIITPAEFEAQKAKLLAR